LIVVLDGYNIYAVTFKEEYRLRVIDNRVLIRIFEPKWEEIAGGRTNVLSEELRYVLFV
jgi:hypothetical protein